MRLSTLLALVGVAVAQQDEANLLPDILPIDQLAVPVAFASGRMEPAQMRQRNLRTEGDTMLLWQQTLTPVPGADWVQLQFGESTLLSDDDVDAVTLKIWSEFDGAAQLLNAHTLRHWDFKSAYFNGDSVTVQVLATADALTTSVDIIGATAARPDGMMHALNLTQTRTLCGTVDNRVANNLRRAARYSTGTGWCSAGIINDARGCFLTAGHCTGVGSMQFQVPRSSNTGGVTQPAPQDQYPVDGTSTQSANGGVGNDWKYSGTFANSNTGRRPGDVQGNFYRPSVNVPTNVGVHVGYGSNAAPADRTLNLVQKGTPGGAAIVSATTSTLRYRFDTTGGDSGSSVEDSSGVMVAVHTHGGCAAGSPTSGNAGTSIRLAAVQNALRAPRGVCVGFEDKYRYGKDFRGDSSSFGGPRPFLG